MVTNLAVLGFHPETKEMMLLATQPGVTVEQVIAETGFRLLLAEKIEENPPPTKEELRILREEVDKERFYI